MRAWDPERLRAIMIARQECFISGLKKSKSRWPGKAEIIREEEDFLKWLRNPNIEEAAAAVRARLKSRDRSVVMQEEKERAIIM